LTDLAEIYKTIKSNEFWRSINALNRETKELIEQEKINEELGIKIEQPKIIFRKNEKK